MNNLLFNVENEIGVITINRPKALNALNSETLSELKQLVGKIEECKDIKAVIVTGSGEKAFVAGADIAEMVNGTPAEGRQMCLLAHEAFAKLENIPQVTIAEVNGYALGGGYELSMACDIRIAADNAKFVQPEVNLGILHGFGGTQRLPRLVGKGRAKELIFTTDQIDTQEAYRIGLANKVVPKDEFMSSCLKMAEKIISKASYAVALAKSAINTSMDVDLASDCRFESDLFDLAFSTNDKKEGMSSFLEKRKADLKDF
ncbi:MAG: Short-chain-enoyl-CoA hydratase [Eubacterium sp.]|uniref:enoyl-CoA hydratase-related protein n=1 Tax=Eubacterium sp. TaxID=142586 RepID=UPI0030279835